MAVPWLLLSEAETKVSSSLAGLLVAAVPPAGVDVARLVKADGRRAPPRPVRPAPAFRGAAVAAATGRARARPRRTAATNDREHRPLAHCFSWPLASRVTSRYTGAVDYSGPR